MSATKHQDYIGFTFNGKHSSEFGIVRTSNGSRFDENLLPTIQDKTVQVPGGDGTYYFGSYYTQRVFNIPFAFDSMTEYQFAELKKWLGDKKIHDLVFDELPYKAYSVKVTGSATIKHIPFAEGETNRVYKGEGSVQFTAFWPFARNTKRWLDDFNNTNKNEWAAASRLRQNSKLNMGHVDRLKNNENKIEIYNSGDIETDFKFTIKAGEIRNVNSGTINFWKREEAGLSKLASLSWKAFTTKEADFYVKIDTKLNLIEGYDVNGKKTGNIYNQYITSGSFFKIPPSNNGAHRIIIDDLGDNNNWNNIFPIDDKNEGYFLPIEYNYYYF